MSFKKEDSSLISKRFVSENEIEEIKRKREEEWELARSEGRKIAKEEDEPYDGRTLYERLKEQKDKKQEEFDEQLKFKNMIYKGLNEEDASFLSDISKKKAELHNRRFNDESEELLKFRAAVENTKEKESYLTSTCGKLTQRSGTNSKQPGSKSQSKMLSGVIIRKRSADPKKSENGEAKIAKQDKVENNSGKDDFISKVCKADENEESKDHLQKTAPVSLGGLIAYSDSESSDDDT